MAKSEILTAGALVVTGFAFLTWYKLEYSMDVATELEVNSPSLEQRVLIATQGSEFKDAVVSRLVDELRPRPMYVKVVDVSARSGMSAGDWTAVVILHTWENWKPQPDAADFVERATSDAADNVFVLATSGAGSFEIEGVDGVSSASAMNGVPARVSEIVSWPSARIGAGIARPIASLEG